MKQNSVSKSLYVYILVQFENTVHKLELYYLECKYWRRHNLSKSLLVDSGSFEYSTVVPFAKCNPRLLSYFTNDPVRKHGM